MAESLFCNSCGEPIVGESPGGEPAQRKPCPNCGSLSRRFDVQCSGGAVAGGVADVVLITYPEALLTTAERLISEGQFSIAVVVAHMACEISTERSLSRAFTANGIGHLEESVEDLLPGYNLANDRVRNLYNAVTGREVHKQPFWQTFKESATRRNQAIHRGRVITRAEADSSLGAARELVVFLR